MIGAYARAARAAAEAGFALLEVHAGHMIRGGEITDAKSVAALLWVERWGREGS